MPIPANDRAAFFRLLPRSAVLTFYTAVFLVFAPLGLLLASSFTQHRTAAALAFTMFVSGALAVSWAATFTISRWFAAGIVAFSAAMVAFSGPLRHTPLGTQSDAVSPESAGAALLVAGGYALFVVFIRGRGREALRHQTEMSLARQIHETLVPAISRCDAMYEAQGVSAASSDMGGDLIDLVRHDGGTDLYLADVSGHGVRAGVVMGMVKSAIRTRLLAGGDLGGVLGDLNRVLQETIAAEMFVTLACLRFRDGTAGVECALAGHHPILLYRAATGALEAIDNDSLPLGVVRDETFAARTVAAAAGDVFVLYTDGLNECRDAAGTELGHAAIRRVIEDHAAGGPAAVQQAVFARVRAHGPPQDDQTLLAVRVT